MGIAFTLKFPCFGRTPRLGHIKEVLGKYVYTFGVWDFWLGVFQDFETRMA